MKLSLAQTTLLLFVTGLHVCSARTYRAENADEVRRALPELRPGDTLELAPGEYPAAFTVRAISGAEGEMITIRAADPEDRPVIVGGKTGIQLSDCAHIWLKDIVVRGASHNGINIDDGGSIDTPAHHIVVENVEVREIGPRGNFDALKMSGVDQFRVVGCRFSGWGGQGIDLVGCHDGVIDGCYFEGREGFTQTAGVQLKGGTRDVVVKRSTFRNAGGRAINLGGSTGIPYLRPADADVEASEIEIVGNTFFGSLAPVAWVSSVGGHVHHNTIIDPGKWVARILQEAQPPRFQACQGGRFENNLIVFDSRVQVFVNVGGGTLPETFTFAGNAWFDREGDRRPQLPVPEEGGIYGIDPELSVDGDNAEVTSSSDKLRDVGAGAYRE